MNKQGSGIAVAALGDAQEFRFTSGRVLSRHQAEIRGEFPAVFEVGGNTCHTQQDCSCQKTNARHLHQAFTGFVFPGDILEDFFLLKNPVVEKAQRLIKRVQISTHNRRQFVRIIGDEFGQALTDCADPLAHNDAILAQQPPDLIDQGRARPDKALPDSVDTLDIRLLRRFVRYKAHVGPLHGFAYGCRIVEIVFRAKQIGFYVSWVDATHGVPQALNSSGPVLGGRTRLHAHKAFGQIGEKADDAGSGQCTLQHGFTLGVHAVYGKRVLCQINADGGNSLHGMALLQRVLVFLMHTRLWRAGPSHLDGISAMLDWRRIEKLLKRGLGRTGETTAGAKAYPTIQMFRVLLLQQWYGLSDQDTESALYDRLSFIRFAGFSLEESVPDHTTICRFRNLLISRKLLEPLLNEVNGQMEKQGKLVKKGVAVDASIIASCARPRKQVDIERVVSDREEDGACSTVQTKVSVSYSHDSDAAWTKKGKHFYYGYKGHASVDVDTGLILAAHATPANHSDTAELSVLMKKSRLPAKSRVYADKGYTSASNRKLVKQHKCKDGIMNRAYRNRPLTGRERKRNKLISKRRGIVERVFGTLKLHYGLSRASYLGTIKVQGELLLSSLAYNIKRALFLLSPQDKCAQ